MGWFTVARVAAGGFFRQIPGWLWLAMAAGLVVAFGVHAHSVAVQGTYDRGYAAGVLDNEKSHIAAQAKADAAAQAVNSKLRTQNDEENRHIAADADALRLRGPGKATCPGTATPSSTAGRYVAGSGSANAAVDQLPDPERPALIAMPFTDTIGFAEQCDANRAEVLKWRESDRLLSTPSQPQEK